MKIPHHLRIGALRLANITIMAPLAGISNSPLRLLAKENGCALVYSEMISAKALVYKDKKTLGLLYHLPAEKPLAVQIFGSEPDVMAEAAQMAQAFGADLLDINCGCAVKKITKTGAGVALMASPELAEAIFEKVRLAVSIPFTIKMRSGWDQSGHQALELAKIAEASGVDALTLHPRTASQGFSGSADWSMIARVKQTIRIPVIGNGDVTGPQSALRLLEQTGCDGIMVGRAAIGDPWIFARILAGLSSDPICETSPASRFEAMQRYLDATITQYGEKRACLMMRSRLFWFIKGLPFAKEFRRSMRFIDSREKALAQIAEYHKLLHSA